MKFKQTYIFAALTALIIIAITDLFIIGFLYYECGVTNIMEIIIFSFPLFFAVFLVIERRINYFIYNRVKQIYNNIPGLNKKKLDSITLTDDLDKLSRELRKFADRKAKEINKLSSMDTYRKDFLGNVAHELKTPLFTVQGYLLTLVEGAHENETIRIKYLDRASKGMDRLTEIVNDLDMITKLETRDLKLNPKTFNIIKLIQNVFDLLEMRAKERNITLLFETFHEYPIYVFADEAKIEQVITNLVMNSIKYGKENGASVVKLKHLSDDSLEVGICDDGEGISKKDLERIFERFYRVDKSRSREQGGSGLGLAIVKHIVEAHGQTLDVTSTLNEGSCFSFTLEKQQTIFG